MSFKYSRKEKIIKEILKRNRDDTCVKCGSEIKENEISFECTKCGFQFHSNWRHNYFEEIEEILKDSPYRITLDFSKSLTRELIGNYKDSADKFFEIREKNNALVLRFSEQQWNIIAQMFLDEIPEEQAKEIIGIF